MLLLVAIALALLVLEPPWSLVAVVLGAVLEVGETSFWLWYTRRRRAAVGVETLVGRRAVVTKALAPRGQVRLDGEVWQARCVDDTAVAAGGVAPGADVVVIHVDGLTLDVEPV